MTLKSFLKKIWYFLWHSDSVWSWLANIIVAFLLIRFVIFPFLGLILGTSYPIVAVISESMEHSLANYQLCGENLAEFKDSFNNYWQTCGPWYEKNNLSSGQFQEFPFPHGFNKGDIIVVLGKKPEKLKIGDILIFQGNKPQPIIHRIIKKWQERDKYYFQTKGDHNKASIAGPLGETKISQERILGKGVLRVPYLGWIKILFVKAVKPLGWTITK